MNKIKPTDLGCFIREIDRKLWIKMLNDPRMDIAIQNIRDFDEGKLRDLFFKDYTLNDY